MNRHSKHRTRTRRAHLALKPVNVAVCTKCQSPVLSHRACTVCGMYNGRQVLNVEQVVAKKLKAPARAKAAAHDHGDHDHDHDHAEESTKKQEA